MGSHSVTFHPTQVNAPLLNPCHTGRYSIYLPRRDRRLSWPRWTRTTSWDQFLIQQYNRPQHTLQTKKMLTYHRVYWAERLFYTDLPMLEVRWSSWFWSTLRMESRLRLPAMIDHTQILFRLRNIHRLSHPPIYLARVSITAQVVLNSVTEMIIHRTRHRYHIGNVHSWYLDQEIFRDYHTAVFILASTCRSRCLLSSSHRS